MSTRPDTNEYDSLGDIIKALKGELRKAPHVRQRNLHGVWVAENYSVADLIRDLQKVDNRS